LLVRAEYRHVRAHLGEQARAEARSDAVADFGHPDPPERAWHRGNSHCSSPNQAPETPKIELSTVDPFALGRRRAAGHHSLTGIE
jgi:hypothetical protein